MYCIYISNYIYTTEAFAYRFDQNAFNRLDNVDSIFPVGRLLCYHGNNKTVKKRKINHVVLCGGEEVIRLNRIAIIIIIVII